MRKIIANVKQIFFANVAVLDMIQASPKQPQSLTGLAIAIHADKGSIKHIMASAKIGIHLRKHPVRINTPMKNSAKMSENTPAISMLPLTMIFITER
jgi:hypothetical protein